MWMEAVRSGSKDMLESAVNPKESAPKERGADFSETHFKLIKTHV